MVIAHGVLIYIWNHRDDLSAWPIFSIFVITKVCRKVTCAHTATSSDFAMHYNCCMGHIFAAPGHGARLLIYKTCYRRSRCMLEVWYTVYTPRRSKNYVTSDKCNTNFWLGIIMKWYFWHRLFTIFYHALHNPFHHFFLSVLHPIN